LKTQIITLESHDDLISVRDKLSWAKTPRILLVWPKYAKVTLRVLDLKVLQRHADSLGAQLGLVTRRAKVKRDAESLGIPVFTSTTKAQRELWPVSTRSRRVPKPPRRDLRSLRDEVYEKEASWRTSLLGRVLAFTVGVLAVLAMTCLFIPRATLTLYPETKTQSVVIPVSASESTQGVSITGLVPVQVATATVSVKQSLAIVSEISVPKSKSRGSVRFTNLSQDEVVIPAGTTVSTKTSVRFVTLKDARLPAGIDEYVEMPIEAKDAGEQGNVAEKTIDIVEGSLGISISVTNPEATKGGENSTVVGATDEDRSKLREVVVDNLMRAAEAKLKEQISSADLLLPDTIEAVKSIEETFTPEAGEPGKQLTLKMQVQFSGRYVSNDDLRELSLSTLNASVENGFVASALPTYKVIGDPSTDSAGVSHFDLEVSHSLLRQVDEMQVFSLVRGHKPQAAQTALTSTLSLRQKPEIVVTPSWYPWLPLIPFNISVEVK
jgi:hypothetical protein